MSRLYALSFFHCSVSPIEAELNYRLAVSKLQFAYGEPRRNLARFVLFAGRTFVKLNLSNTNVELRSPPPFGITTEKSKIRNANAADRIFTGGAA